MSRIPNSEDAMPVVLPAGGLYRQRRSGVPIHPDTMPGSIPEGDVYPEDRFDTVPSVIKPDVYWFVCFELRRRGDTIVRLGNIILRNIHPLVWAARPSDTEGLITVFGSFHQISEEVAHHSDVLKYFSQEEH